jgi:hypothetical protein
MKAFLRSDSRSRHTTPARRAKLLAAFNRSDLSAAAFARKHHIRYTTFCGWRSRRAQGKASPRFVQVELPAASLAPELVIELGAQARVRVSSTGEIGLVAQLIQNLNVHRSC